MPVTRNFKQAFSGGEISPEMFGRIDDKKYQQGAATMRNFIAKPQGPAAVSYTHLTLPTNREV